MSINKNTLLLMKSEPTAHVLLGTGQADQVEGDPPTLCIFESDGPLVDSTAPMPSPLAPWTILRDGDDFLFREAAPELPLAGRAVWSGKLKVDPKANGLNRTTLLIQRNVLDTATQSKVVRLGQARIEFTSSNLAPDSERSEVLNDLLVFLLEPVVQELICGLKPIII